MRSEKRGETVLSFCWLFTPGIDWKSQQIKNTKFLTVIHEMSFWCYDTHAQFSWIRSWWVLGMLDVS